MGDYLLSFEFDDNGQELFIHGDQKGLERLCDMVSKLVDHTKDGHFNHDHWMTPEWSGHELSSKNMGGHVINQVKIYCWKGDKSQI